MERIFRCNSGNCGYVSKYHRYLMIHLKSHELEPAFRPLCTFLGCNKKFKNVQSLRVHLHSQHKEFMKQHSFQRTSLLDLGVQNLNENNFEIPNNFEIINDAHHDQREVDMEVEPQVNLIEELSKENDSNHGFISNPQLEIRNLNLKMVEKELLPITNISSYNRTWGENGTKTS